MYMVWKNTEGMYSVQVRDFEMKVTGLYGDDVMKRQVASVTIQHTQGTGLLNRQDGW